MPYQFYLVLHLLGVFMVVGSLSAMAIHVIGGGTRDYSARRLVGAVHGAGLAIVLIAGFGLLARLGLMTSIPLWAIGKLIIWLILGGMPALIYNKPNMAKLFWLLIFAFAATASTLAIYKP